MFSYLKKIYAQFYRSGGNANIKSFPEIYIKT